MIDLDKCLPTPEMRAAFEQFKSLGTAGQREAFKEQLAAKLEAMPEADRGQQMQAAESGLKATLEACGAFIDKAENALLKEQLGELPEAVSLSYIARKYFGKSRSWLYQRINGYAVNGKPARFTENEFKTFQHALEDIGGMIRHTTASLKLN